MGIHGRFKAGLTAKEIAQIRAVDTTEENWGPSERLKNVVDRLLATGSDNLAKVISIFDAGSKITAGNVEDALQELAGSIAALPSIGELKQSAKAATTGALAASTYANGTAGVGATLTENANGALGAQDGVNLIAGDRLLVKDQAAPAQNGLYIVTQIGDGAAPFILTRVTDCDAAADFGKLVIVPIDAGGTTLGEHIFGSIPAASPFVVGTTGVTFGDVTGLGLTTAGGGLTKTGSTLDVGAGDGIQVDADSVTVKLDGTTLTKSGNGLKVTGVTTSAGAGSSGKVPLLDGAGLLDVSFMPTSPVERTEYDAQTVLVSVLDNTPLPATIASGGFVGRPLGGNVGAMTQAQALAALDLASATKVVGDSPFTVPASDAIFLFDCTGGAITANLPAVATSARVTLRLKKIDATGNAVTVDANGAEVIDGALTQALGAQWASIDLYCNGSAWYILG